MREPAHTHVCPLSVCVCVLHFIHSYRSVRNDHLQKRPTKERKYHQDGKKENGFKLSLGADLTKFILKVRFDHSGRLTTIITTKWLVDTQMSQPNRIRFIWFFVIGHRKIDEKTSAKAYLSSPLLLQNQPNEFENDSKNTTYVWQLA